MCKGKGTPGNSTTGRGKSGSSCNPRTLSLASLIDWLATRSDYGRETNSAAKRREKIRPPPCVLGNVGGGHRAHRPMKRVSSTVFGRTPKGVCVRMSKNLREQFQPMNGGKAANAREHVFQLKGFGEEAICAGVETRLAHLRVSVRTHNQNSRARQVAFDVFNETQTHGGRVFFGRHLQVQYRDIRLVKGRPPNSGLHIVRGHHVVLITQRPVELLCDLGVVINYRNPGLHSGHPLGKDRTVCCFYIRTRKTKRMWDLQGILRVDGWGQWGR